MRSVMMVVGAALLVLLMLQGCTTTPAPVRPPPVVEQGSQAPAPPHGTIQAPSPGVTPAPVVSPEPPAVLALLDQAEQQANAGELESAAVSLERAIRISPRNAVLWYHLATVRLEQGLPSQAEQLAMKSNSLAPGSHVQQARNWRLIARARRERNDPAGAAAADRRARELESQR